MEQNNHDPTTNTKSMIVKLHLASGKSVECVVNGVDEDDKLTSENLKLCKSVIFEAVQQELDLSAEKGDDLSLITRAGALVTVNENDNIPIDITIARVRDRGDGSVYQSWKSQVMHDVLEEMNQSWSSLDIFRGRLRGDQLQRHILAALSP